MSEPATEPVTAPEPPIAAAPKKRDPQQVIILLIVAVLILVIAGLGASLYLNRAPAKMTVSGGITVTANPAFFQSQAAIDLITKPGSANCQADPSGADIPGAQIVISDAGGKTVGVGTAGQPVWASSPTFESLGTSSGGSCLIPFTVRGVAKGSTFYSIAITGHGSVKFTDAEMSQPLSLDLH